MMKILLIIGGAGVWAASIALSAVWPAWVIAMISFVGGLMLGCGLAIPLMDWLDR
jgi:hypothetical protein